MTVKIIANDKGNPPGKLADAELHFADGPLEGSSSLASACGRPAPAHDATSRSRLASTASTASVVVRAPSPDHRHCRPGTHP